MLSPNLLLSPPPAPNTQFLPEDQTGACHTAPEKQVMVTAELCPPEFQRWSSNTQDLRMRLFKGLIKLNEITGERPHPSRLMPLYKEEMRTQTHTEGRPGEDTGRPVSAGQGERPGEEPALPAPCLGLPAARTVGKEIPVVSALVGSPLLRQP